VKFWDSSAIIPLVISEQESESCSAILREDTLMMVWALSAVEVLSAIHRRLREGTLDMPALRKARERLREFEEAWTEVKQLDLVRDRTERLLAVHPLRAADSLQLAAALIGFDERTEGAGFVTFDRRLAIAAEKEGFTVRGTNI
jgi:predicted nucleic acid-binding protein